MNRLNLKGGRRLYARLLVAGMAVAGIGATWTAHAVTAASISAAHPSHAAAMGVSATKVIVYKPGAMHGKTVPGSCFSQSVASTLVGAWRCSSGNGIYDPCFSSAPNASAVTCVRNPVTDPAGITLSLSKPLPAWLIYPGVGQHVWTFQVGDGTTCSYLTGALPVVNGKTSVPYACSDKMYAEGTIQTGKVWFATKVPLATVWW
jgi:hypothetical protein